MSANFIDSELSALKDAVAMALEYANSLGTSAAEVAISKQQGLSVSTRLKEVETVEFNKDGALGITLYRDGHKGSSSTSDLSPEAIRQAVKAADGIARYTSEDPASGLADSELMAKDFPDLDLYHPVTPARKSWPSWPFAPKLQRWTETRGSRIRMGPVPTPTTASRSMATAMVSCRATAARATA